MGNQFLPDGQPRRAPAATNRGRKPTFKEVLRGTDAVPADTESDDDEWQDEYSSFQSQIATHDMFIHIQWEQKLETLTTFLAHCEDRRAIKAHRGRLGAKLQAYHDTIKHVWQMKAQHKCVEPRTQRSGPTSTSAECRGMGEHPHPNTRDLEQPPSRGAPLPGSTTYQFRNRGTDHEDRARARSTNPPARAEHTGVTPVRESEAASLGDGADELACPIHMMVQEAINVSRSLGPDNDLVTCIGVKIPHPEPYLGEADLKKFKTFIVGILRWLSMSVPLTPDTMMLEVKYMGTCLADDTQEWYIRNVEHHGCTVREWMLESLLQAMQKQFLHMLTHRQASVKFDTTRQGSGMVQTMLNCLEKFALRMVTPPDEYTMRWRFLAALRDLLRREVLTHGYTAEFRTLEQLVEVATSIEDAVRYDMGTRIINALGSTNVAQQKLGPHRAQAIITLRLQTSGLWPTATASKGPPILQMKLTAHKGASCPQPSQRKPAEIRAVPGIAPGQAGPVCYRCGQPGHIQSDCPQPPERPRAAAVRIEGEDREKEATHAASDVELQEEEVPPADAKQGETLPHQSNGPGEIIGDWEPTGSQYDWDEEGNEEETPRTMLMK